MQRRISQILSQTPGLKGREIAKIMGVEKSDVNRFLATKPGIFAKDSDCRWSVSLIAEFVLDISACCDRDWISSDHFELALSKYGSPLELSHQNVRVVLGNGKKIVLCAISKILALINQLANEGRSVILDMTDNTAVLGYLSRAAFMSRLDERVSVLPNRPSCAEAEIYLANNDGLVELLEIGDIFSEDNVPARIKHSYAHIIGGDHANKLFTVVAESVTNVQRHSSTEIPGVAGMQSYSRGSGKHKIVTVISDSGEGICSTLRPALDQFWPEVAANFPIDDAESGPKLIIRAMQQQGLSRTGEGGAGLHATLSKAQKLDATISVRQETFSVKLVYKSGKLQPPSWELDLPQLAGTHIVFEFLTTKLAAA